jgi:hypothetical protein
MKTRRRGGAKRKSSPKRYSPQLLPNLKRVKGVPNTAINLGYLRSSHRVMDIENENEKIYASDIPDYIVIRKSTIPNAGKGVFTMKDLPIDHSLGIYLGKAVPDTAHGDYVLDTGAGFSLDGKSFLYSNWTRYINTGAWRGVETVAPNVRFVRHVDEFDTFSILVQTTRPIAAGEEIIIDYGKHY